MKKISWLFVILVLINASCKKEETIEVPVDSQMYSVIVTTNWSSNTHPTDYPDNAHFSTFVGMSHKSSINLFKVGEKSSPGVKLMAETGKTEILNEEITEYVSNKTSLASLQNSSGISTGIGTMEATILVSSEFSLVSLVSMIAPSPDWFVGIENVNLYSNGEFLNDVVIDLESFDAGTDKGLSFKTPNDANDPAEAIYVINDAPLGNGSSVNPSLGSVRFIKLAQ
ncbi:MAG: spondin domain-containing protein [Salibacteraceae bacterium]